MMSNLINKFPFNQPEKTRDCGYRCLYYCLGPQAPYEKWLDNFRFFKPVQSGISFTDICTVLDYHGLDYKFTQLREQGLFIVYSGIWLHPEGKRHGHYFVYHDGRVLCSTKERPYKMSLEEVVTRLEAKTIDHAFRSLLVSVTMPPVEFFLPFPSKSRSSIEK